MWTRAASWRDGTASTTWRGRGSTSCTRCPAAARPRVRGSATASSCSPTSPASRPARRACPRCGDVPMTDLTSRPVFTGYDRGCLVPTVVHLGPGGFHRAHQAVYADAVLRTGAPAGAVWGVSLRSPRTRDALRRNDFVYHVVERSSAGPDVVRPVGALLGIDVAADGVEPVLARLVDPAVTVVTVTVTEHGYCATRPGGPLDTRRPEVLHDL